jgi:hypothetical protein
VGMVAVCVAAWVGSYWVNGWVCYLGGGSYRAVGVHYGAVTYHAIYNLGFRGGWEGHWQQADREMYEISYASCTYRLRGFGVTPMEGHHRFVMVPLWVPTALAGVMLWGVWQRRKRKGVPGAFPVEEGEKS